MKLEFASDLRRQRAEGRAQKLWGRRVGGRSRLRTFDLRGLSSTACALTLIEVMIAMAVFFMAIFAILKTTTDCLRHARNLRISQVDIGGLAALVALTNRLDETLPLPNEIVHQFEELNPGYSCQGTITEVSSNGLFRVDFEIVGLKGQNVVGSTMSILLYRPESASSFRNRLGSLGRR